MKNRIRKLRLDLALSQDYVADMLGISRESYGMYDREQRSPSYETLVALADFYHVSVDYILNRTDLPCFLGDYPDDKQKIVCDIEKASDEATKIIAEIICLDARNLDEE